MTEKETHYRVEGVRALCNQDGVDNPHGYTQNNPTCLKCRRYLKAGITHRNGIPSGLNQQFPKGWKIVARGPGWIRLKVPKNYSIIPMPDTPNRNNELNIMVVRNS